MKSQLPFEFQAKSNSVARAILKIVQRSIIYYIAVPLFDRFITRIIFIFRIPLFPSCFYIVIQGI